MLLQLFEVKPPFIKLQFLLVTFHFFLHVLYIFTLRNDGKTVFSMFQVSGKRPRTAWRRRRGNRWNHEWWIGLESCGCFDDEWWYKKMIPPLDTWYLDATISLNLYWWRILMENWCYTNGIFMVILIILVDTNGILVLYRLLRISI